MRSIRPAIPIQTTSVSCLVLIVFCVASIPKTASGQEKQPIPHLQIEAGMVVESIQKGSAAEKAGIRAGDNC